MRGGDETMFQSYAPTSDQAVAELATGEVIEAIRHQAGFLPEVQLAYEPDLRLLWVTIKPELKPVFTLQLLDSLGKVQQAVMDLWGAPEQYHNAPVRFLAFRGTGPFFTLGGDLDFYLDCLAKNDRPALAEYARLSVEDALRNASGLNGLAVTLSTIHAKAIGGGIDAPRSCNVMIAEEQASFVYPEIKFNHFPITAVGLLSRRMGPRAAERMLQSGEEMSAAEFMAAGGLEAVVPTGTGEDWDPQIRRRLAADPRGPDGLVLGLQPARRKPARRARISRPALDRLHAAPASERDLQAAAHRPDAGPHAVPRLPARLGRNPGSHRRGLTRPRSPPGRVPAMGRLRRVTLMKLLPFPLNAVR